MLSTCVIEDYRPDCQVYNYGDVEIINNSNSALIVYIDWDYGSSQSQTIYSGRSLVYYDVPAGYIRVYSRERFRILWSYDDFFVYHCELNSFEFW